MAKVSSMVLFMVTMIMFAVVTTALYIKPEDINPKDYCGIEPYPTTIMEIQPLSNASRQMGLKQLDHHLFFRHGDRSTIGAKCFNNVPTHAERIWTECPNPIYNFHSGLTDRENDQGKTGRPNYYMTVQPLPEKNILKGNCHFGQLTQRGVMMSYNNGYRYARYLNQTQDKPVSQSNFRTRSTDVHRTRETGESFMTGIYDQLSSMFPNPGQFTPQNKVPIFTFVDNKVDASTMNDNMCNTVAYNKKAYADPKWIDYQTTVYNPLSQTLAEVLNQPSADTYDVFDCAKTLYCHGNPLPPRLDQYHTQMEAALLNYYIQSFQYNHTLSNILYTGVWAAETIALITPSLENTYNDNIYYMNSGHDGNIQALLHLLGFGNLQWPPYSAIVQMELYRSTENQNYIRFLYEGKVVIPEFCTNPINGELCDTKKFITFLTKALPLRGECQGIPRQSMKQFKDQMSQYGSILEIEAMDQIEGFINGMDQVYLEQDQNGEEEFQQTEEEEKLDSQLLDEIFGTVSPQQPLKPLKERSHQETWAKFQ